MHHSRSLFAGALALCLFSDVAARAAAFTWVPTAGGTYDWNVPANWNPNTGFPGEPEDVANLNNNIAGNQTVRLREDITLGVLNLGDAAASGASFAFTINNFTGDTFELIFESGELDVQAQLNVSATGTPTNAINVPVTLTSDLRIAFANTTAATNAQRLTFGGELNFGSQTVTVVGGYVGASDVNQLTFGTNADVFGTGRIVNDGETPIIISNPLDAPKSFTGTVELNGRGSGGSNTGSLTLTGGSLADAEEFIINGALSAGVVQAGGSVHSGDSSTGTFGGANPGQRLTSHTITLNGGTLTANGQAMNAVNAATLVEDTVETLRFNSAYSLLTVNANTLSAGTRLNVTSLERTAGASGFLRGGTLGGTARLLVDNADDFLLGANGAEGTATMSVIPWMVAANTNGSAASADTFATHTDNGIRGLSTTTEYAAAITAGAASNVSAASVAITAGDATVNALRYTGSGASNMGAGKTLIIASGGLIFSANNGAIGATGNAAAGALQFGETSTLAEAVVWSNNTNVNTIGASIRGSLGLTKAGTGTLVLTGANLFSGNTYVGGGTLQIGNGTTPSNLSLDGDVAVANGALLSLFNGNVIPDDGNLTLEQFGLLNGRVSLSAGVNETVGALLFGDEVQLPGTWGSAASGAMFKSDLFFTGTGILTVIPEPASAAFLACGAVGLLSRRRRA